MNRSIAAYVMALGLLVAGLLPATGSAGEDALCAPFMDGKVDTSLVSSMLQAAADGYLYRIRQESSQVGFCVDSEFKRVEASFRDFSGGVALTPASWVERDQQAMVVIRTASLDTRGSVIENLIKSESFFDVEKYPEILFVSRNFEWLDKDKAKINGELTVHGVTRPVALNVTLTPSAEPGPNGEESITIKASTVINRADFGMDSLSKLVSNQVKLCMSVEVVRYHSG
ncbi:MAG: YceI family protein [Pseudomonadota bacterium]